MTRQHPTTEDDLERAVDRLARSIALAQGFQFAVLAVTPRARARAVLERLAAQCGDGFVRARSAGGWPMPTYRDVVGGGDGLPDLFSVVLAASGEHRGGCILVDLDDPSPLPRHVVQQVAQRLNELRNNLAQRVQCTLLLKLPPRMVSLVARAAPDLWSVRSVVVLHDDGAPPFGVTDGSAESMRRLDLLASTARGKAIWGRSEAGPDSPFHDPDAVLDAYRRLEAEDRLGELDALADASPPPRAGLHGPAHWLIHLSNLDDDGSRGRLGALEAVSLRVAEVLASHPAPATVVVSGGLTRRGVFHRTLAPALARVAGRERPSSVVAVPGERDESSARRSRPASQSRSAKVDPGGDAVRTDFDDASAVNDEVDSRRWWKVVRGFRHFAASVKTPVWDDVPSLPRDLADPAQQSPTWATWIPGTSIGVACVDSSWNTPGPPVIGLWGLLRARVALAGADTRIAVLRHPFAELHPVESELAREFCNREFDLVLHGPAGWNERPALPPPGERIVGGWSLARPIPRNSAGFNMIELGPRPRLHRFVATDPDAQAFEPLDVTDLDPA
ncbi:MAG: hypothetical protein U0168_08270 [Nannocystaceae bacterium]